jgi:hypothetical protein
LHLKETLAALAGLIGLPILAAAGQPFTLTDTVVVTASIEAIDHDARLLTLLDGDGDTSTIHWGPAVDSFDRLEVGDTVTFRYYESVAYVVRHPGQPIALPATTGEPVLVRGPGPKPGATVSRQQTATLTIEAIDSMVPSVTALTEDGRRLSFGLPGNDITDLRVGDRVEITYTRALVISVSDVRARPLRAGPATAERVPVDPEAADARLLPSGTSPRGRPRARERSGRRRGRRPASRRRGPPAREDCPRESSRSRRAGQQAPVVVGLLG